MNHSMTVMNTHCVFLKYFLGVLLETEHAWPVFCLTTRNPSSVAQ